MKHNLGYLRCVCLDTRQETLFSALENGSQKVCFASERSVSLLGKVEHIDVWAKAWSLALEQVACRRSRRNLHEEQKSKQTSVLGPDGKFKGKILHKWIEITGADCQTPGLN